MKTTNHTHPAGFTPGPPKLDPQRVWRGRHRGIEIKIVNWKFSGLEDKFPSGAWNYYVYLHEFRVPNFAAIWLEDKATRFTPTSPLRVSHDYYDSPLASVKMHCGITYYSKHGHTEGCRCVEIGCDYQHLYDDGQSYDENDVLRDAVETIDDLHERGLVAEEKP